MHTYIQALVGAPVLQKIGVYLCDMADQVHTTVLLPVHIRATHLVRTLVPSLGTGSSFTTSTASTLYHVLKLPIISHCHTGLLMLEDHWLNSSLYTSLPISLDSLLIVLLLACMQLVRYIQDKRRLARIQAAAAQGRT